jgi:hypothetical protein
MLPVCWPNYSIILNVYIFRVGVVAEITQSGGGGGKAKKPKFTF